MADIRLANVADLESILEIYNHAIATTTAVFDSRPHTLETRRNWFKGKQSAELPVWVAVESEGVVGFATYGPFRAWPGYKYTIEHSVYVAERARRAGVGCSLMKVLLADAQQREYHTVVAGIVADNVASLRLHESLGFVEIAHFREVGYKFGRWQDLKFLQLIFL
jgi:phosphinothricin acetyltransferase